MFTEVPDEHVSTASGYAGVLEIRCRKRLRKVVEAGSTRVERLEHLSVTGGVGTAAFDDVSSVFAIAADRPRELVVTSERGSEPVTKLTGLLEREFVGLGVDCQTDDRGIAVREAALVDELDGRDRVRVTAIPAGEFRDQERLDSVSSYPIGRPARRKALLSSVCDSLTTKVVSVRFTVSPSPPSVTEYPATGI